MDSSPRLTSLATLSGLILAGTAFLANRPVQAQTCPETISACFGPAWDYSVVSRKLNIDSGYDRPETEWIGSRARAICSETGRIGGNYYHGTTIERDLILSKAKGMAGRFKGVVDDYFVPVDVFGDLVTGGGRVKPLSKVYVSGVIDTTGMNPKVDQCRQAWTAVETASQYFASLPRTQYLDNIVAYGDEEIVIPVGPGINVFEADSLVAKPKVSGGYYREILPSAIYFQMADATSVAIVNVKNFVLVGNECWIGGESGADNVVLNLYSQGAGVQTKYLSRLAATVIVPQGRVRTKIADNDRVFARSVFIRGSTFRTEP